MLVTRVLNLVINGMPSILSYKGGILWRSYCFKPCYKWNAFNTKDLLEILKENFKVLNLVINGMPSILSKKTVLFGTTLISFKPCYKWNAFNTYEKTK